jgi:4-amino-4-deoxy-L-arabinose transferase-like glycosyltransferase
MNVMHRILIIIGLLAYCLAFQGARGLWEPDEGRYTGVAMEMLRQGDWLKPDLHREEPHWTKPPLTYWVIAASLASLGHNEFTARLVSSLSFFLTIIFVYLLGRIFIKNRAWLPPLIYASFLFPFIASNIITTDGLLTLWETIAVCAFAYATWGNSKINRSLWMMIMWGAFGFAFLTKGPPGLLPLIAIIIYRMWICRKTEQPRLFWFPGILIMVGIGMSWFVRMIAQQPELLHYFIFNEVYGRIVTGAHGRNSEWYRAIIVYLPVLVLGTLPWTFWLARYVFKNIRNLFSTKNKSIDCKPEQDIFLLLWLLAPLLIFMISSSRLPLYILPLFVPLSLLASLGLEATGFFWNKKHWIMTAVWLFLLLALRLIAAEFPSDKNGAPIAQAIKAATSDHYTEIAFYNTNPVRGLNFYLNKEVENVTTEMLADEFEENENPLWIMRPEVSEQFLEKSAELGKNIRQVGRINERYLLFRKSH